MTKCRALFGCLLVILTSRETLALPALAAYGVDALSNLWTIDLTTGVPTLVGRSTGHGWLEGLALAPDGRLFATDNMGKLYQLNTTTGAAVLIGATSHITGIEGLDFMGNTLIGADMVVPTNAFSLNLSTAASTTIRTATATPGSVRAMAVVDTNTLLIRTDGPSPTDIATNVLRSMDLTTGNTTVLGTLNTGGNLLTGLDFASDGNLYGVDTTGDVLRINPANAAVTLVGSNPGIVWLDMTSIPEPRASVLLLLAGSLAALARRCARDSGPRR